MRLVPIVMTVAAFAVTASITAFAGASVARYVNRRAEVNPRAAYTAEHYVAATQRVTGSVSGDALRALEREPGTTSAIVLVVRRRDIDKCEDLGRQLRVLRRALPVTTELLVLGDSAHTSVVRDYLRLERISNARILPLDANRILEGGATLPTPAVLIVGREGQIVAGVAHPVRFANARFSSFAEELAVPLGAMGGGLPHAR